jgi:hypothetical protein
MPIIIPTKGSIKEKQTQIDEEAALTLVGTFSFICVILLLLFIRHINKK